MPVRVERKANHVEVNFCLGDRTEHIVVERIVSAVCKMDDNLYFVALALCTANTGSRTLEQFDESIHTANICVCLALPRLTERPHESAVQFVSNLNHVRTCISLDEFLNAVFSKIFNCFVELFCIHASPCSRHLLFGRISPKIAVVKINEHFHAGFLCTLCELYVHINRVVSSANRLAFFAQNISVRIHIKIIHWIIPHTQTNPVHAILFEDVEKVILLSFSVVKFSTVLFNFSEHTYVGATHEVRRKTCNRFNNNLLLHRISRTACLGKNSSCTKRQHCTRKNHYFFQHFYPLFARNTHSRQHELSSRVDL